METTHGPYTLRAQETQPLDRLCLAAAYTWSDEEQAHVPVTDPTLNIPVRVMGASWDDAVAMLKEWLSELEVDDG